MACISERRIFNVVYRMNEARIYDETPYVAGETRLINDLDQEVTQTVEISYTNEKVYTFSRGSSVPGVANTTISAGLPFIGDGRIISVSAKITDEPFQWGIPKTISGSVAVTTQVTVPPNSSIVVKYGGTQGSCSIPYSYTQEDKMSNGQIVTISQDDGTYNGVSRYNFGFTVDGAQPL